MTEIEQLARDSAGLRQLEMLMRISGLSSELQSSEVPLKQIDQDGRYLSESLGSDLVAMQARGWIQYVEDYDGIDEVTIQQRGRDVAQEFATLRHNVPSRLMRLVDDLLKWLYESELNEDHPHIGSFRKSSYGAFMGLQYNDDQVARAAASQGRGLHRGSGALRHHFPSQAHISGAADRRERSLSLLTRAR